MTTVRILVMGEHRSQKVEEFLGVRQRVRRGYPDGLLEVRDAGLRVGRRAAHDGHADAPLRQELLASPGGGEVARAEDHGVDVRHQGPIVEEAVDLVVPHDPVAEFHDDDVHVLHLGDDGPGDAGDVLGVDGRRDAAIEEAQRLDGAGDLHAQGILEAGDPGDLGPADLQALPRKPLDQLLGRRGLADMHAGTAHQDDGLGLGQHVDLGERDFLQVPLGDAQDLDLDGLAQVLVPPDKAPDDAAEIEDVQLVAGRQPVGRVAHEAAEGLTAAQNAGDDVAFLDGHPAAVRNLQVGVERVLGQGPHDDELAGFDRGLAEGLDRIGLMERRGRRRHVLDPDLHGWPLNSWAALWETSCGAVAPGEVFAWTEASGVKRSNTSLSNSSLNFRRSASFIFAGDRSFSAQCLISRAMTPCASRKGMPFLARYSARSVASIWGSLAMASMRSFRTVMPSIARWMARRDRRAVSAAPKTGGLVSCRSRLYPIGCALSVVRRLTRWLVTVPALPRTSSIISGFFFWGMIDE